MRVEQNADDAGHSVLAEKAEIMVYASSAPNVGEVGHCGLAGNAYETLPASPTPNAGDEGHSGHADEATHALSSSSASNADGEGRANHAGKAVVGSPSPSAPEVDDAGRPALADKAREFVPSSSTSALDAPCASIRYWHRQRCYAMEQRKRANLALGSFLRMALGWSLNIPKPERDAIRERASELMDIGEGVAKQEGKPADKRKLVKGEGNEDFAEWRNLILASVKSRAPFDAVEAEAVKQMGKLAAALPVWPGFGEAINGFGALGLAIIVGEAGNLSGYPKKGHLWKRMGVAVIDGTAQGRPGAGATAQDWIVRGYNKQRRSRLYTIGDSLIKKQGPYRDVYLARKEYDRARAIEAGLTVAPSAKIPAKRAAEFMSDGIIHRRAQRYMEKRLLRDLLAAWKKSRPPS